MLEKFVRNIKLLYKYLKDFGFKSNKIARFLLKVKIS